MYLYGGQVTSWRPRGDGQERLFLSERAQFRDRAAIRGGIPVIFPQFGPEGRLPRHGFARTLEWELLQAREAPDGAATVTLRLASSRASWKLWRHRFSLELTVRVSGQELVLTLRFANEGKQPFRFAGGLQPYLRVEELANCTLVGLRGCKFSGPDGAGREEGPVLRFDGELERSYLEASARLQLEEPGRGLELTTHGLPDLEVWNPGPVRAAFIGDLEPGGDRRLLCLAPAVIAEPLRLLPGERHQAELTLRALP